jgi:hypothetical protein
VKYTLSPHAAETIAERDIPLYVVEKVLQQPEQIVDANVPTRKVYQSRFDVYGRIYLVRVFVVEGTDPLVVVSAYRTTQITRYWQA